MIPNNMREFFARLATSTSDGEMKWTEVNNLGRRSYFCERRGLRVEIAFHWDDDAEIASISVRITTPDESVGNFTTFENEDDYFGIRQLYELATISAARILPDALNGFFDPEETPS